MGYDEMLNAKSFEEAESQLNNQQDEEASERSALWMQEEMLKRIDKVDEYAWARGEMGGLDWGVEQMNEALEGCNTGIHLIAGQPNIGKSALCMQLAHNIAHNNQHPTERQPRKAYVLYFSLDDSDKELIPRAIAIDQKIPINAVRFPKKYEHEEHLMERRAYGLQRFKDLVPYFSMKDSSEGTNIEYIQRTIEDYKVALQQIDERYQLCVFIDNFHDLTSNHGTMQNADNNRKYEYIAGELTDMADKYDCPIICTAEFRKLNGMRRPTNDDIRKKIAA